MLIEFKPFSQQVYEETLKVYSTFTVCSVHLKGRGVRPEVKITPEDGLLYFANLLVGEQSSKEFEIKNISGFPVKFSLIKKFQGCQNKKGLSVFSVIPSEGIVNGNSTMKVKIIFAPDRPNENFFEVLTLDVPNQINEKKIFI